LKILDALNHGVPVVSTRIGYAGLELVESKDIYVGDTPDNFAEKICDLIGSREKRETIARNGRDFVAKNHGSINVIKAIEDLQIRLDVGHLGVNRTKLPAN
jgi:glycosyltransferase involved in cell wall biosynthesis